MPNTEEIVINTSPMIALVAALGEAAVIQLALDEGIQTVCIDETAGRRVARLNGLAVTGSIAVLLRAQREGYMFSMREAIDRMTTKGIRLSRRVTQFALDQSGEARNS
jgi:predicted nucleic acid-binding protein